jgi:uncharacterized protein
MSLTDLITLCVLILLAATTYSAVGHAGASAYIAAMALYGLAPEVMKPTALVLNIFVATYTTWRMYRAGLTDFKTVLPFVIGSIPLAFVGGAIHLPAQSYRLLIGAMLLFAAYRLWVSAKPAMEEASEGVKALPIVPLLPALAIGAVIGLLSGLTGTGGGIFLSPVLVMMNWATIRRASGIAAPFILVNSLAGLAGNLSIAQRLPSELPYFLLAAMLGALLGAQLGVRWLPPHILRRVLAVVLLIAALKFMLV